MRPQNRNPTEGKASRRRGTEISLRSESAHSTGLLNHDVLASEHGPECYGEIFTFLIDNLASGW